MIFLLVKRSYADHRHSTSLPSHCLLHGYDLVRSHSLITADYTLKPDEEAEHVELEDMRAQTPERAHEQLIRGDDANDQDADTTSDSRGSRSRRTGRSRTPWLVTVTAGLSGLLFGYDTGVISSTLISLGTSLSRVPNTWDKSLIASSTALFALLSSPISGPLADSLGRKPVILAASLFFILGALIQAFAGHVWVMVLGRSVIGIAVGAASGIVPLYIAEIAPAGSRGRLVTVQSLFITGGQVVAYLVGWAVQGRWRVAVGVGALPAVLQGLLLFAAPESPRWLVMKGREGVARAVLEKLGSGDGEESAEETLAKIREEVEVEGLVKNGGGVRGGFEELVRVPGHRRALIIACMLQGLQQLCGFNSLMYFSATIFALVGFANPVTTSLSIAGTNFLFTLFAFALIDSIGRRRILLLSIPFMFIGLALCAISFLYIHPGTSSLASTPHFLRELATRNTNDIFSYALLISLVLYVAAYATGLGCVPWQQAELFPLSVRSLGSGVATATNWSSNFIVGISFLPAMEFLGPSITFTIYALVCVVGWVVVYKIYPETKGLALEDVGRLLDKGWGVDVEEDRDGGEDESEREGLVGRSGPQQDDR